MSGSVSGSQFNFVPRATPSSLSKPESDDSGFGVAGREFSGPRSLAPLAKGAFSSQDQAFAFRHQGENILSHSARSSGSWLYRPEE